MLISKNRGLSRGIEASEADYGKALLNSLGISSDNVFITAQNGKIQYGPRGLEAFKQVQRIVGADADGAVGNATLDAIYSPKGQRKIEEHLAQYNQRHRTNLTLASLPARPNGTEPRPTETPGFRVGDGTPIVEPKPVVKQADAGTGFRAGDGTPTATVKAPDPRPTYS